MNYTNFITEDFIKDSYFIQWVKTSDEEISLFWNTWLEEHPDRGVYIKEAREFIESLTFEEHQLSSSQEDALLNRIKLAIDSKPSKKRKFLLWASVSAASVALCISLFFYVQAQSFEVYQASYDKAELIELPNGVQAHLNRNSTLKVKKNWTKPKNRFVLVEGDAYFEEASKSGKHFQVRCKKLRLQERGARFYVNGHQEKAEVVLIEGALKYSNTASNITLEMVDGEIISYKNGKKLAKKEVNTDIYHSWTEDVVRFDNTPLSFAIELLENNFGYEVRLKDNSKAIKKRLSGDYPLGEGEIVFIQAISTALGLNTSLDQKKRTLEWE